MQAKICCGFFLAGDTDDDDTDESRAADHAGRDSKRGEKLENGVNYPWNLLACIAIGLWLMTTRLTVSAEGSMANADHLIGSLVITVAVTALAEVWRKSRDRYGC